MGSGDDDFLALLRATFRAEAQEHIESISASLVELERTDSSGRQGELVDSMFREVHSLNGAAGAAGEPVVARICHDVESLLSAWKRNEAEPTPAGIDSMSGDLDRILELIGRSEQPAGPATESATSAAELAAEVIDPVERSRPEASGPAVQGSPGSSIAEPTAVSPAEVDAEPTPAAPAVPAPAITENMIRVAESRIDDLLLVAEELLVAKVANERHASSAAGFAAEVARWRKGWSAARSALPDADRLSVQDVQLVIKLLDRASAFSDLAMEQASELAQRAQEDRRAVGPLIDDLLAQAGRVAMLPFSSIVGMYSKTVRDLARVQGKMAEVFIVGGDIELDRRVLEQLRDPLLHAIRNAVSHGIEPPAERQTAGKEPIGHIQVEASRGDDGRVVVTVSDDGKGLDVGEIRKAARRAGLPTTGADADDPSAWAFAMGVSTSPELTNIAGRGVGLSVVKENIAALEGTVSFESTPGSGATLRMVVPTTRATIHGVVLEVAGRPFVLPIAGLDGVTRISKDEVLSTVRVPTVVFNG
ncbi:MAG: ATP-binding protein, partial [Actinomycetes bacterium]